jgi:protease-4
MVAVRIVLASGHRYDPTVARRRAVWILIAAGILAVLALWAAAFAFILPGGGGFYGEYEERVIKEGSQDKVVLIDVLGEITSVPAGPLTEAATDDAITSQLDQAVEDPEVVGVILDLDTPGGSVVASDNIYRKVLDLRTKGKPVVALMEEVAASGGYYISAAANEVVANPTTITGSIGVIILIPNVEEAANKLGIRPIVIKSGPHKDIASPFRDIPPDELEILKGLIDEAYTQFVQVVASGRKMDEGRVREIADGRILTGNQAKSLGLIDHLGGLDLALGRVRALAESPRASLVRYQRAFGLGDLFASLGAGRNSISQELVSELRPGLKYLWLP